MTTYNDDWAHRNIDRRISKAELQLAKTYKQASNSVKAELGNIFEKYAQNGILTYAEMSKYNRLNTLYKSIQDELNQSWGIVTKDVKELIGDVYNESFYQYGFLVAKDAGINLSFGLIPKEAIWSLVNEPNVSGLSLMETLGKTRYNLLLKERQEMTQGFIVGESYDEMARRISDVFNKSFNDALRIVRTEGIRSANEGQVEAYDKAEEMGISMERMWVATLDNRTRDPHGALDGEIADEDGIFTIPNTELAGDYAGAQTQQPGGFGIAALDINCRCRIVANVNGEKSKVRRSNIGDKEIIEYKTYQEWRDEQG